VSEQPINDGGPAFPGEQGHTPDGLWNQTWEPGLSTRDYFAAHAPPMTNQWWEDTKAEYGGRSGSYAEALAAWNYFYADRMLAARTGKGAGNG
jgi:hypothetical protein